MNTTSYINSYTTTNDYYTYTGTASLTVNSGNYDRNTTYSIPGYNVYFFKNTITPTNSNSQDQSGSFVINITGGKKKYTF